MLQRVESNRDGPWRFLGQAHTPRLTPGIMRSIRREQQLQTKLHMACLTTPVVIIHANGQKCWSDRLRPKFRPKFREGHETVVVSMGLDSVHRPRVVCSGRSCLFTWDSKVTRQTRNPYSVLVLPPTPSTAMARTVPYLDLAGIITCHFGLIRCVCAYIT
jgi:hypothetical protein